MNTLADLIYKDAESIAEATDLSSLQGKSVLITGITGLVGTYFAASLKQAEANGIAVKVIAVVHNAPDAYFKELLPKGSEIIAGDLTDPAFLQSLPSADIVIHAAGYGQPGKFLSDPVKTLALNTLATSMLAEKVKTGGKFLFVSTSEIYSGSKNVPYKETDIGTTGPEHPRACYIEGKRSGEAIADAYRAKGLDAKAARLSLAYGPGTKKGDQRVLNSFIEKALNGEIAMMDSGAAKRTYCYVTDAVEMMWKILLSGKEFVYNVGGESKTTIAELAAKIGGIAGAPVKAGASAQALGGAPEDVWLDLSKAKKEFSKTDFVGLDAGLARTIEWQRILYGKTK
ncbi:MAG TPA: NAD-dependent epimerase/dehydratase family protein [Candidatus Paceibacterota bacterium]|nr:NAD-dependent epimerase/dehydratase family protein [Candidatus Paceibacterota bacterium]